MSVSVKKSLTIYYALVNAAGEFHHLQIVAQNILCAKEASYDNLIE